MVGWFRRSPKPSTGAAGMETAFHDSMSRVKVEMSNAQRTAVAYGVAFAWRTFNSKFSSGEDFLKKPSAIKMDFINDIEKMRNAMAERNENEVATGIALANMYFAALSTLSEKTGDAAMVNRMADQLEPLNKEGTILLNIGT
jgi:hypothetical protein